jgi:hypothetical protein
VGDVTGVVDYGAARGAGGVERATWGTTEVMSAARRAAEVDEVGNEGVAQGLVVGPPRLAVTPPASVRGQSDRLDMRSDRQPLFRVWSDHQPLFWTRSDCPDVQSNHQL